MVFLISKKRVCSSGVGGGGKLYEEEEKETFAQETRKFDRNKADISFLFYKICQFVVIIFVQWRQFNLAFPTTLFF